jgi:tRNA-specific 2-thiouridylase
LNSQAKEKTRDIAKKNNLSLSDLPESQEACFVNSSNDEFLRKRLKLKKGNIVDIEGNIIGKHNGLWLYTIGQRRGIGLEQGPYWVVSKNIKKNELVVSKNEKDLIGKEVKFKEVNWIVGMSPSFPIKVMAKIRYGHSPASAILMKNKIIFNKPQKAITPGQSVVFYKGKELIGGGIII